MITEYYKLNQDTSLNRYDIVKFMKPEGNAFWDICNSEFIKKLNAIKTFNFYTVTVEEGRPDLISERIYGLGNSQFWWILMLINGYVLPTDIKNSDIVKYPPLSVLETIYFSLLDNSLGNNVSTISKEI